MKKWEYLHKFHNDYQEVVDLDKLGKEGWELVSVTEDISERYTGYYFKREVES